MFDEVGTATVKGGLSINDKQSSIRFRYKPPIGVKDFPLLECNLNICLTGNAECGYNYGTDQCKNFKGYSTCQNCRKYRDFAGLFSGFFGSKNYSNT